MLVIRRKAGESVLIGDEIEIEVIDVSPSRVKLGFKAPDHVTILRKEIQQAREQNQRAAQPFSTDAISALVKRLRSSS